MPLSIAIAIVLKKAIAIADSVFNTIGQLYRILNSRMRLKIVMVKLSS